MLRTTMMISGSITNNSRGVLSTLPDSVCVQCVRWRRKPRWLPVAKSKMFRIPVKPILPPDEKLELTRLHNNYKTQMRSLRRHILETITGTAAQVDTTHRVEAEIEDLKRCAKLNDEWNQTVAKEREIRLENERKIRKEQIMEKLIEKEKRDHKVLDEIDEKIRKAKAESDTFITEKNIDQAIEDALNNPVDHNWALDENGTVYHGKYVKPEGEDSEKYKRAMRNL